MKQKGQQVMFRKPYYLIPVALAACLVQNASAVDYNWSGLGDGTSWSDPLNWVQGVVPPNTANGIFVDPVVSTLPVTIGASDVVQLTGTLYPEWGQTLDIYGTVNAGYSIAPVGATAGPRTVVNLYGNASLTTGDSIFVGDMWWWSAPPGVDVNLYGNSQMTTKYLAVGGHLNIYGGTVTALNGLLTGTPTAGVWGSTLSTDATRLIDIAGGKLVVVGDATAQVNDLIARGILEGNGVVGNVNIDLLSDPGFTVITVPEPASVALLGLGGFAMMLVFRRRSSAIS
jgi:hypothetical protein